MDAAQRIGEATGVELSRRTALQLLGALAACEGAAPGPQLETPKLAPSPAPAKHRIVHYELRLDFDFQARTFEGRLELRLKVAPGSAPLLLRRLIDITYATSSGRNW